MKNQIIAYTIGMLTVIIGFAELIPAALELSDGHQNYKSFLICSIGSIFFGGALVISNSAYEKKLNVKQTFLLTTLSWLTMSVVASLPLYFADIKISFTDAFFESVSAITTTGSTVLSGLDDMSRGVLLWRSITQWIGGIGIIAFAILILPFLQVGGMQLFQTESSDRSDKVMPKTFDLVTSLLKVYLLLTLLCTAAYYYFGMNFFDAINHAMTTIPTGGYSTHDASFGYFTSPALQYSASFFMLAGGIPFVLYVKFIFQGHFDFFKDEQFNALMIMLAVFITILSTWLWYHSNYTVSESIRHSVFNIISVITTTGYATVDYTLWGSFSILFFFLITHLGACAGSTAGGIKVMRLVIASKIVNKHIKTLIYPHGMFALRYQGRVIENDVTITVMSFLALFVVVNALLTLSLSLLGLDFETAISASATALANVGPGIGDIIGPSGNFSPLPTTAKWLLSAGMIFGRLEILTILVLFRLEYWRS